MFVVAVIVAAAGALLTIPSNAPSYKGKPLGYWLNQLPMTVLYSDGGVSQIFGGYATAQEADAERERLARVVPEAQKAVDTLGTNCLHTLVARLASTDSSAKLLLQSWTVRLHLLDPRRIVPADRRREQALTALLRLGGRAKPVVPDLLLLTKSDSAQIRAAALYALRSVVTPVEYSRLEREGHLRNK
jgi:hypothetical protein